MAETIRATGKRFEVGDSMVTLDTDGQLQVTSPGGFGGTPRTDRVAGTVLGIGRDSFDDNRNLVREVILFEAV